MIYIGTLEYRYSGMVMSHMASPDLEELHAMAVKLGVRRFFQKSERHPHYDICKSKKVLAIQLGAVEVSDRDLICICYPKLTEYISTGNADLLF